MKNLFRINKVLQRRVAKEWRRLLEQPRRLIGLFNKGQLVVFGRLTKGHCLAILFMSRFICRLYKRNGPLFTAQYLKQAKQLVLWYLGSRGFQPKPSITLHIKQTRSGLPRLLPPFYRKMLRLGDGKTIKMVVTVLSFYSVMVIGKKGWRRVAHKTVHIPHYQPSDSTREWCSALLTSASSMLAGYSPRCLQNPLTLGFRWEPVFTSGPNTYMAPSESMVSKDWYNQWESYSKKHYGKVKRFLLTQYHTLPVDATALMTLWKPDLLMNMGRLLYHERDHVPIDGYDNPVLPLNEGVDGFNWLIESLISPAQKLWWGSMTTRPESGRFGLKLEGAGKVRTFAIPNPIVQALMRPLHNWEMSALKSLITDGTYDQLAPLRRLQGRKELYSFDLKAATDMFPAVLTASMLSGLFGDDFGLLWYTIMNQTAFRSPERVGSPRKARIYRFTRGQPLGFLSSWPSFALTHHMVVWLAAWRVYPSRIFKDYALLGDDIVIADKGVAEEYMKIMTEMGGIISIEKSLLSDRGCCEFAKKFYINYHRPDWVDASPLSSACLILSHTSLATSPLLTLGCGFVPSFRLKGAGYRVLSRVDRSQPEKVMSRLSRRWKRHWLSIHGPSGINPLPLTIWLAYPEIGALNCYQLGVVRWFFVKAARPKDIDEESINLARFFWEEHEECFERFLVSFMQAHLRYLKWYCSILFDYEVKLEDLLRPPVSPRALNREKSDSVEYSSYGLMFRAWDLLRTASTPLALEASHLSLLIEKPFVVKEVVTP